MRRVGSTPVKAPGTHIPTPTSDPMLSLTLLTALAPLTIAPSTGSPTETPRSALLELGSELALPAAMLTTPAQVSLQASSSGPSWSYVQVAAGTTTFEVLGTDIDLDTVDVKAGAQVSDTVYLHATYQENDFTLGGKATGLKIGAGLRAPLSPTVDLFAQGSYVSAEAEAISAFGSVLAFTRPLDLACAEFLVEGNRFVEAIVAPSFDADALELLTGKPKWGKSVRLLAIGAFGPGTRAEADVEVRKIVGGFLLQGRDLTAEGVESFKTVSKAAPSDDQLAELAFANKIAKHVKSNAIVLTQGHTVVGVGAGQMSRVDSVRLAAHKAGDRAAGSVLASDAFFPFPDGVEAAIEAGVVALVEPGGSVRDDAVIEACDAKGVPMVFSGARHFRH